MGGDSQRQGLLSVAAAAGLLLVVTTLAAGCVNDTKVGDASARLPSATGAVSSASSSAGDKSVPARVPEGVWAGEHVVLMVTAGGAEAEFDCATGVVTQPLSLDGGGHFEVPAFHTSVAGGPASTNAARSPPIAARYRGWLIDAQHLTLAVELTKSGQNLGPFELELGGEPSLERCV